MATKDVLILGAGPAGMSAALALAIQAANDASTPLRITIFELRPELQTIGGAIQLIPQAMKYLDYLGAGEYIRERACEIVHGVDYISPRTGKVLGNVLANMGAVRVARTIVVESLLRTIQQQYSTTISIQWGKKVTEISESEEKVVLTFHDGSMTVGDALIGADGLYSAARRLWVEPSRTPYYTGRVVVMGFSEKYKTADEGPLLTLPDGSPAVFDTSLISDAKETLIASYWETTRTNLYFAYLNDMDIPEGGNTREGWKKVEQDTGYLKENICSAFMGCRIEGILELVNSCEKWQLWPVNILPGRGQWCKGKVLLIGDASHAMPPQGESTGYAIEDGVLAAHVFSRRDTRSIEQLWKDFETLRKPVIDMHYMNSVYFTSKAMPKHKWLPGIVLEYANWLLLMYRRWAQKGHYSGNVRELGLPD